VASYTSFEFGFLLAGADNAQPERPSESQHEARSMCHINERSFSWLKQQYLSEQGNFRKLFKFCSIAGVEALQLRNYVGVIATPYGDHIEVLPKIARSDSAVRSRQALLNMLCHLHDFRHIESRDALVQAADRPLLEVFIGQFLQSVNTLIKRGLRSDYRRVEANQAFIKGRLLVHQQLRHNLVNQHKFYVEYDEFLTDRPVNRLIHRALMVVAGLSGSDANPRLCRELRFAFAEVPASRDIQQDFAALRLDRGMDYYDAPLAWSRLILYHHNPVAMAGRAAAASLLFPMEAVFESYVADILRRQTNAGYHLREQLQAHSLVRHGEQSWFRLKPDLALYDAANNPVLILDTKWKRLNSAQANGSDKYGLSQSDLYQMFAYGQKYLNGKGTLVLIYPKTDDFQQAIAEPFVFSERDEQGLKLYVVPFDVGAGIHNAERLGEHSALAGYFG